MDNPWLGIPLADYEGHMESAGVEQLGPLAELFRRSLEEGRPESVVVLGVAGGNGLEAIDPRVTRRVQAVDVNPEYLEATRQRFGHLPLTTHCLDLGRPQEERTKCGLQQAALVHAALVFEHIPVEARREELGDGLNDDGPNENGLRNALRWVQPGGQLSVVLQLPSAEQAGVAPTGYASLQRLRQRFRLIRPEVMTARVEAVRLEGEGLEERRFRLVRSRIEPLASGKALWQGFFEAGFF